MRAFQKSNGLKEDGIVGEKTFALLTEPMTRALTPSGKVSVSLSEMVVMVARQHLRETPMEVGGQNCGPWVRLYTKGKEGEEYPWCAGFVSFIIKQAADTMGIALPLKYTLSCDDLASQAKKEGMFILEEERVSETITR